MQGERCGFHSTLEGYWAAGILGDMFCRTRRSHVGEHICADSNL